MPVLSTPANGAKNSALMRNSPEVTILKNKTTARNFVRRKRSYCTVWDRFPHQYLKTFDHSSSPEATRDCKCRTSKFIRCLPLYDISLFLGGSYKTMLQSKIYLIELSFSWITLFSRSMNNWDNSHSCQQKNIHSRLFIHFWNKFHNEEFSRTQCSMNKHTKSIRWYSLMFT